MIWRARKAARCHSSRAQPDRLPGLQLLLERFGQALLRARAARLGSGLAEEGLGQGAGDLDRLDDQLVVPQGVRLVERRRHGPLEGLVGQHELIAQDRLAGEIEQGTRRDRKCR